MKSKLFLFLTPILHFLVSFNFPFIYWPEMLNWPFILSRGWLPYRDFTIIHTPILPYVLTLFFSVFGFDTFNLHLFGTLLLSITNFAVVIFIYKLTRNKLLTILAGLLYIPLSLAFEGNTVWFESFLTPFLVAICYLQISFLTDLKLKKIALSGLLMGIVLLTKQTSMFLLPEFGLLIIYLYFQKKYSFSKLTYVTISFFAPVIILIIAFFLTLNQFHILSNFFDWAIKFSLLLPFQSSNTQLPPDLLLPSRRQTLMIFIFTILAAIVLIKKRNFTTLFLIVWFGLSILFIIPRFSYFHLLPSLPFFLALVFLGINSYKDKLRPAILLLLPIIFFGIFVMKNTFSIGQRFLNPEIIEISSWLNSNFPNATVFSLNGPDLVYFFTKKTPAVRPWVDQLPWEIEYFGDKYILAFTRTPPEIVVFRPYLKVPVDGLGAHQPKEVVTYVVSHYKEIKRFPGDVRILKRL